MSKNLTIARPYAKAAFELAQAEKALSKWSDMLDFASAVAGDKLMMKLMKNPQFSKDEVLALFLDLGKDVFSNEQQNFIKTLARFKRLACLPEIAFFYEQMRKKAEQLVNVQIISARPIEESFLKRIIDALKKRTSCDIMLECSTDKTILGGAIIQAGDLVIDGSIRGRLAKLSDAVGIS